MCEIVIGEGPRRTVPMVYRLFRYIKFLTGEMVLIAESQWNELHAAKYNKKKDQYIVISAFKMEVPYI